MSKRFVFTPLTLKAIGRHARAGASAAQIARIMSCERTTIENICRRHGIALAQSGAAVSYAPDKPRPCRSPLTTVAIPVSREALHLIEQEAARRKTSAPVLIAQISEAVAGDALFGAVLD